MRCARTASQARQLGIYRLTLESSQIRPVPERKARRSHTNRYPSAEVCLVLEWLEFQSRSTFRRTVDYSSCSRGLDVRANARKLQNELSIVRGINGRGNSACAKSTSRAVRAAATGSQWGRGRSSYQLLESATLGRERVTADPGDGRGPPKVAVVTFRPKLRNADCARSRPKDGPGSCVSRAICCEREFKR